jgi:formiminotetrahydrofolate cyclodeaminase
MPAMPSVRPYLELTVGEWLDELAAARAAPGGGSALALAAAGAAAVAAMAARISENGGLAAQAEALRARTEPLAQLDADAYEEALAVRDAVQELSKERRDFEIGRAFRRAAEQPLEIGRAAADIAELAEELARSGSPLIQADAIAAAVLAAAAARGAVALVSGNLTAVDDDVRVQEAVAFAEAAEAAAKRAAAPR